jgi:hypothetical protein
VRGPNALENVMGSGCMLDALLFIRTNKDSERRTFFFFFFTPAHSNAIQVAVPPRTGPHKPLGPMPWLTSPNP